MACRSESGGLLGGPLILFPSFRRRPESRKKLKTLDPGVRGQKTEDRNQRSEIGDQRAEIRNQDTIQSADGGFIDGKEKTLDPGSVIPAEAGTGMTEKRIIWNADQRLC